MKVEVSTHQREVLDALLRFHRQHGHPPTVRDLCYTTGRSPSVIQVHLAGLTRKGYLERRGRSGIYWPIKEGAP